MDYVRTSPEIGTLDGSYQASFPVDEVSSLPLTYTIESYHPRPVIDEKHAQELFTVIDQIKYNLSGMPLQNCEGDLVDPKSPEHQKIVRKMICEIVRSNFDRPEAYSSNNVNI